jgi:hypothetical protein
MDQGGRNEQLSLLSFRMIYKDEHGVLHKHTHNLIGSDNKQDALLTWACLAWLLDTKVKSHYVKF